jgi:hypothetical protein
MVKHVHDLLYMMYNPDIARSRVASKRVSLEREGRIEQVRVMQA